MKIKVENEVTVEFGRAVKLFIDVMNACAVPQKDERILTREEWVGVIFEENNFTDFLENVNQAVNDIIENEGMAEFEEAPNYGIEYYAKHNGNYLIVYGHYAELMFQNF